MIKVLSFEEVIPYLRMPTKGWPPYIDVIEFLWNQDRVGFDEM